MIVRRMLLGVLLVASCLSGAASAEVNVNVNIGVPLPELVLAAPPALAVISGTYIYVAADANADLVFYHDNWYRPHGGTWYVSLSYNGPWKIAVNAPVAVTNLPRDYRAVPPGHHRMPYGQVKDNWRTWERDRHWDHEAKRDDHSYKEYGHGREEKEHHTKHKKHDDDDDRHDDRHDERETGRQRD